MLPKFRLVVAIMAALALVALGIGVFSAPRNNSVFAIGLRSAQGSAIERSLPEPPDWKQFVALAALRRSQELDRLLDLPVSPVLDADQADAAAPTPAENAASPGGAPDSATAITPENGPVLANLAERGASTASPDAPPDVEITGAIDRPPPDEAPIVLTLPELPDIPDVTSTVRQALVREAAEPQADVARSVDQTMRMATAPAAETETPVAPPAVSLPTRVRLPPVKPPRVVVRKKPPVKPRVARVVRAPPRKPAAVNPAPADPLVDRFGASR